MVAFGLSIVYDNCQFCLFTYAHELKPLPPPEALAYSQSKSTQCSEVPNPKLARRLQLPRGFPGFGLHVVDLRQQFAPLGQFDVSFGSISVHLCQHISHVYKPWDTRVSKVCVR